jgi:hypothetical protein
MRPPVGVTPARAPAIAVAGPRCVARMAGTPRIAAAARLRAAERGARLRIERHLRVQRVPAAPTAKGVAASPFVIRQLQTSGTSQPLRGPAAPPSPLSSPAAPASVAPVPAGTQQPAQPACQRGDLDDLVGQVLRRIESRAIAQRERLGTV